MSSVILFVPNFKSILLRCLSIVYLLKYSSLEILILLLPLASKIKISFSLLVNLIFETLKKESTETSI